MLIGREPVIMLVDTGAQVSCLNKSTYQKLQGTIGPLQPPEITYFAADGQLLQQEGISKPVEITWGTAKITAKFLILPDIPQADGIAGLDLLRDAKAIINFNKAPPLKILSPTAVMTALGQPSKEPWKFPAIPENIGENHRSRLRSLLEEYRGIMSQNDTDVGRTQLIEHEIRTVGGPVRVPYRRQNPLRRQQEDAIIQDMLKSGIISESNSPWCAATVLTYRKSGEPRLCTDFRKLNEITVRDAKPMPRVDEAIEALAGAKYYATLDVKQAFWNIPIKPKHRSKTAFASSDGRQYEYNVLPFGLSNGSATCARMMNQMLKDLEWKICITYLDDVVIFADSIDQLIDRIQLVFQRIKLANIKLNPKKCELLQQSINFLGHIISPEGLSPDQSKLAAIRDLQSPKTLKETRQALGLFSYYRRFLPKFSAEAAPLNNLLKNNVKWQWTPDCEQAFQSLKTKLINHPVTALPSFDLPFKLYVDGSQLSLGAILAQDVDHKERIIACASRTLTESEKNYSATKLECLALVYGITHFRPYLEHAHFDVYTDHYSLKYMKNMKTTSALFQRWWTELENFNFTVHYRPGKNQNHVDCLSRLPRTGLGIANIHDTPTDVQKEKEQLYNAFDNNQWPTWISEELRQYLTRTDDRVWDNTGRIVLGPAETYNILKQIHQSPFDGGHMGTRKILKKFRKNYRGVKEATLAKEAITTCPACQKTTDYKPNHQITPGMIRANDRWEILSIDIMGPINCEGLPKYVLTAMDVVSRYAILIPCSSHTTQDTAQLLIKHVFSYFGFPRHILSDRAPEYCSHLWEEISKILGYKLIRTNPYCPQGNSQNERCHRTINNMLRAIIEQNGHNWKYAIAAVQLAFNTSIRAGLQYSPYEIMFGKPATLPLESNIHKETIPGESSETYLNDLKKMLHNIHNQIPKSVDEDQDVTAERTISINDQILVQTPPFLRTNKYVPPWMGPYPVLATPNRFQITYDDNGQTKQTHVRHVKRWKPEIPPCPLVTTEPPPRQPENPPNPIINTAPPPRQPPPPHRTMHSRPQRVRQQPDWYGITVSQVSRTREGPYYENTVGPLHSKNGPTAHNGTYTPRPRQCFAAAHSVNMYKQLQDQHFSDAKLKRGNVVVNYRRHYSLAKEWLQDKENFEVLLTRTKAGENPKYNITKKLLPSLPQSSRINSAGDSVRIQVMFGTNISEAGGSMRAQANRATKEATVQKTLSSGQQSGNTQRGGAIRPVAYISESYSGENQSSLGFSSRDNTAAGFSSEQIGAQTGFSSARVGRTGFSSRTPSGAGFSSALLPNPRPGFSSGRAPSATIPSIPAYTECRPYLTYSDPLASAHREEGVLPVNTRRRDNTVARILSVTTLPTPPLSPVPGSPQRSPRPWQSAEWVIPSPVSPLKSPKTEETEDWTLAF